MADIRFTDNADITTLALADKAPVTKNSDSVDYYMTMQEIIDLIEATGLTLGASLVGGAQTISGTAFDINGGAIDAVTLGTNSAITEAQIDNLNINGNTISSTSGDVNIAPLAGEKILLDGTIEIDGSNIGISGNSNMIDLLSAIQMDLNFNNLSFTNTGHRYILIANASSTGGKNLYIKSGNGDSGGDYAGGDLNLNAGIGYGTENGGDVVINGGHEAGSGDDGNVKIAQSKGVCEMGVMGHSLTPQTLTSAGAINGTTARTRLNTTSGVQANTIADGQVDGQIKYVTMIADGGNATLTANIEGTSITWSEVGHSATLLWDSGRSKWYMVGGTATWDV